MCWILEQAFPVIDVKYLYGSDFPNFFLILLNYFWRKCFCYGAYYSLSAPITHTDINGSYAYMLTVEYAMCSDPSFCLIVLMFCEWYIQSLQRITTMNKLFYKMYFWKFSVFHTVSKKDVKFNKMYLEAFLKGITVACNSGL